MRILVMGLPGAGKTTLTKELIKTLEKSKKTTLWLNADKIRETFNDWDFSYEGRIRQSIRMRRLANESEDDFIIADFIAPLKEMRDIYDADFIIWVDTIEISRYEDTDKIFEKPKKYNIRVNTKDAEHWVEVILTMIGK